MNLKHTNIDTNCLERSNDLFNLTKNVPIHTIYQPNLFNGAVNLIIYLFI